MASTTPNLQDVEFSNALGKDALIFRRMQAVEELGRLCEYRIEVAQAETEKPLDPEKLLGTSATVKIQLAAGKFRYVNGWVTAVEQGAGSGRYKLVRIEMRPWLYHLTLGQDCRIFQELTAVQIIEKVFADYSTQKVEKKLTGSFRTRPYCVQYNESDFDFVSRLMEDEGIYYYFKHADGQHTMVLCNGASGPVAMEPAKLSWIKLDTTDSYRTDIITQWRRTQQLRPLKFTHTDYDHEKPATSLLKEAKRTVKYKTPGDLEVFGHAQDFAFPGDAKNAAEGERLAKLRVAQFEAQHVLGTAATRCGAVSPGLTFSFTDHPNAGDYLIVSANWEIDIGNPEADEADAGEGFSATISVQPKATPFATQPTTRRPYVQGPQTAVVVGKSGDEIHTDKFGRVKVHFRWDRQGKKDEKSSCFVRVSTPWASKGYGAISLPRVGDEVVISFLEGNPDKPLITGHVYNGENLPAYALPANATVSGIKSRSSKGGAAANNNELRFEDKKGSEYVWFHAEKDFARHIKNDAFDTVLGKNQWEVKKTHVGKVGETYDLEVGKAAALKIGADGSVDIVGDLLLHAGGGTNLKLDDKLALKVAQAIAMSAGMALDIDAGQGVKVSAGMDMNLKATMGLNVDGGLKISLKAGPSSVVIGPDGVSITGPLVKINSGGAASPAAKAQKASPTATKAPKKTAEKKDPLA